MGVANILILDDEPMVVESIRDLIELETDYAVLPSTSPAEALEIIERTHPHAIVTDFLMPGMNGIDFLIEAKKRVEDATLILITGYADMQSAVESLTLGAYDYIEKPVGIEKFRACLERGLENKRLVSQLNFAQGLIWLVVLSIPLWMVLGIVMYYFWKN